MIVLRCKSCRSVKLNIFIFSYTFHCSGCGKDLSLHETEFVHFDPEGTKQNENQNKHDADAVQSSSDKMLGQEDST
jgi:hypothetical protein